MDYLFDNTRVTKIKKYFDLYSNNASIEDGIAFLDLLECIIWGESINIVNFEKDFAENGYDNSKWQSWQTLNGLSSIGGGNIILPNIDVLKIGPIPSETSSIELFREAMDRSGDWFADDINHFEYTPDDNPIDQYPWEKTEYENTRKERLHSLLKSTWDNEEMEKEFHRRFLDSDGAADCVIIASGEKVHSQLKKIICKYGNDEESQDKVINAIGIHARMRANAGYAFVASKRLKKPDCLYMPAPGRANLTDRLRHRAFNNMLLFTPKLINAFKSDLKEKDSDIIELLLSRQSIDIPFSATEMVFNYADKNCINANTIIEPQKLIQEASRYREEVLNNNAIKLLNEIITLHRQIIEGTCLNRDEVEKELLNNVGKLKKIMISHSPSTGKNTKIIPGATNIISGLFFALICLKGTGEVPPAVWVFLMGSLSNPLGNTLNDYFNNRKKKKHHYMRTLGLGNWANLHDDNNENTKQLWKWLGVKHI